MQSSRDVCAKRWQRGVCLIGWMLSLACGSGNGGSPPTDTDTDDTETPADPPGNLPNLSTHSNDVPPQEEPEEPADCEVLTLSSCVNAALEELSGCLAAGHGGAFAEDRASCALTEADALVTFPSAIPRWSSTPELSFVLEVSGQTCARYTEQAGEGAFPRIELVTAQHSVTFETAADLRSTLSCDGVSVSFAQSSLSGCQDPKPTPTPELMDQTRDGLYEVSPRLHSDRRVFSCRFP